MAIRRKKRIRGNEAGNRLLPLKGENVQKNMERLRQIVNAASARVAAASNVEMASVQSRGEPSPSTVSSAHNISSPETHAPDFTPALNAEQVVNQAGDDIRAAMQTAESAIKRAEALLLDREAATDERIVEAQRIAEHAVADAISQSEAALRAAMNTTPSAPQTPAESPASDAPTRSQVF
jgi:hypothetical protein